MPPLDKSELDLIYSDQFVDIHVDTSLDGPDCLVSFTGIGHNLGGVDVQTPEFRKETVINGPKIFVTDKLRSWGNNLDLVDLGMRISTIAGTRDITTMGNSMGGFLAILFSSMVGAKNCIAFAPQFSIDPHIVPNEDRWRYYRRKIKAIQYQDLKYAFDPDCTYWMVFGDGARERIHSDLFLGIDAPINAYQICDTGHDAAKILRGQNALYPFIKACLTTGQVAKILSRLDRSFNTLRASIYRENV